MLFQYIGDGKGSPKECEIFDYHFILNGEPVDVTNERAIKKLMGNKTFLFEPALVSAPSTPVVNEPEIKEITFNVASGPEDKYLDEILGKLNQEEPSSNVVEFPQAEYSQETFCGKIIKKLSSWYK